MYTPAAFSESDREKLFDFIEQFSFGLLVTQSDDGPVATHLPLLLDRTAGQFGISAATWPAQPAVANGRPPRAGRLFRTAYLHLAPLVRSRERRAHLELRGRTCLRHIATGR